MSYLYTGVDGLFLPNLIAVYFPLLGVGGLITVNELRGL